MYFLYLNEKFEGWFPFIDNTFKAMQMASFANIM
jgi:hypothetical protein